MAEVAIADFDFMLNSKNALILLNTYNFEINKKTYDYLKEQQIRHLDGIPFTVDTTAQVYCINDFNRFVNIIDKYVILLYVLCLTVCSSIFCTIRCIHMRL